MESDGASAPVSGDMQNSNVPPVPVEGVAGGGTSYGWNEDDVGLSQLTGGDIDPRKVHSANLLHVWCMPSTANVGQQEVPRRLESIALLAARNERESIQIALRPKVSWCADSGLAGVVQIQATDLCSSSEERLVVGKSVTLRRVVSILGVPDALVPLDVPVSQINLLPGETTAIWASVTIPYDQPPGQYEGQILITAVKPGADNVNMSYLPKGEKCRLHKELKSCLDVVEPLDNKPLEEVVERAKSTASSLRELLLLPTFDEYRDDCTSSDMMDEDSILNTSVSIRFSVTVWDFALPLTPSLPSVFGVSETVIEDRFCLQHGSQSWYDALDRHFEWLLQYRISPFFCRWGENMRVLAYTCPWPADHPKADGYYSDPRLAAYAIPYLPILSGSDTAKDSLRREVEVLKSKPHWKKGYFYLWDEPVNIEQYDMIRSMSSEIRAYAPDARVLTTYYCGPSGAELASNSFEVFLKVPGILRPHTQIFCTSEWVLGSREDIVKDIIGELQPENDEVPGVLPMLLNSCDMVPFISIFHICIIDKIQEWWTYVCLGPTDPHPNWHLGMRGTQHRAVMWRVWKEGGTGFLYWGANCYEKATVPSAELRFRRGLPPGDGVLFYPGEVFSSSNEPVASVRLERILSGLQDIEYLKLYSSKHGKEAALSLMERRGVYLGPERYTLDHGPIDLMRADIYQACNF